MPYEDFRTYLLINSFFYMGNAGRPRKPVHIKEAQGTLEKSRELDHPLTYSPLSKIPTPSTDLNEDGQKYYEYICKLLLSKHLLTPAFLFDIERSAFWYQQFKYAQREIGKFGSVEESKSGWKQVGAYITLIEKATKFLNEFDNKYGLNLVAGQRIEMPETDDGPDF